MSDYHLHLHPHGRAYEWPPLGQYPSGLIESYVEAAAARGVTELGFTEHLYRTEEGAAILGRFWENERRPDLREHTEAMVALDSGLSLSKYVDAILAARQRGLPVKLGLEVDFFPSSIEAVLDLLAPYPFDFLIGSVHWVGGWSIDSPDVTFEFARRGIDQAWDDYFAIAIDLAGRGVVDVLAHIDLPKKFGHQTATEPLHLYRQVVDAAVSSGTSVEVSSAGLRMPIAAPYPSAALLKMFFEAGVEITLASDAHTSDVAGYEHDMLMAYAMAAGYTEHLRFDRRVKKRVPLT
ncbi:MAG: histidinol-phosphatase HisJ family protein [Acidimicrobiia bacterium]